MEDPKISGFFQTNPLPHDISDIEKDITKFCEKHAKVGTRVALITSGGTTVPLEHNTVRFVDNFSAGTRGSASAEYFLKHDYAVIFLHRVKSLEPFVRHFPYSNILNMLQIVEDSPENPSIQVIPEKVPEILPVLKSYASVKRADRLLKVTFTTLSEYLHLLRATAKIVHLLGQQVILYLAAAVSDFYIPQPDMATHKIPSSEGPLNLHLHLVPKVLQPLVCFWVPNAFVVSFKLETDESVLLEKAHLAVKKYGHKLVIANMLHDRKYRVVLVTEESQEVIVLSKEEAARGMEIEEKIVADLVCRHTEFIQKTCDEKSS